MVVLPFLLEQLCLCFVVPLCCIDLNTAFLSDTVLAPPPDSRIALIFHHTVPGLPLFAFLAPRHFVQISLHISKPQMRPEAVLIIAIGTHV